MCCPLKMVGNQLKKVRKKEEEERISDKKFG